MTSSKALGKGFGSLLPSDFDDSLLLDKEERVQKILIQDIKPDPAQPRKSFDKNSIAELAQSIKTHGILQPLVLVETEGGYMIVAGERRYHAAKQAGLSQLPALVRSLEELERLEISLIENVQRVDLAPLEQAQSIARLNEQFSMSYQDIAKRLGKAYTTVVNITRLLQLPDIALRALSEGKISEGHARSVLALKDDPSAQEELVSSIIEKKWSVRRAEQFVIDRKHANNATQGRAKTKPLHPLSEQLGKKLHAQVRITETKKGGKVQLVFEAKKDLEAFIRSVSND
jgi:ParB family chromosome partitioning protein